MPRSDCEPTEASRGLRRTENCLGLDPRKVALGVSCTRSDAMIGAFVTRLRRQNSPLFRILKRIVHGFRTFRLPLPDFFRPVLRFGFQFQQGCFTAVRWILAVFIYEPLFRG